MTTPIIVIADDTELFVTLTKDDVTFTIAVDDTVKAALVSTNHTTELMAEVDQFHYTNGADWANSLVGVVFTEAQTSVITETGKALLEIQVTQNGIKTTWFSVVKIIQGHIS